jgi:choline-sulfatase
MLGERGMWFKQCFWEWSARVPLIISVPGGRKNANVGANTSLVDLLPTQIGLAGNLNELPEKIISGLAGNDLGSLIEGNEKDWPDCAIADYLSIGPCVPARMVRKGNYKFMYTHGHPDLLFDLVSDPDELNNLATDQNHKKTMDDLKKQAMKDYDPDLLMLKVIESQQRRLFIKSVPGEMPSWDHIAYQGDEKRYVRRDGVDGTKSRLRLPRVETVPPDLPELSFHTIKSMMEGEIDFDEFSPS